VNPELEARNSEGRKSWVRLAPWLVGYKALFLGVCLLGLGWFDVEWEGHVDDFRHGRWEALGAAISGHLTPWDGEHYLKLASQGYRRGDGSCAFYPLWPALIRLGSYLTGGNLFIAGLVLANVISLLAWWNFHCWVAERHGRRVAKLALVFLLAFPGAVFFQFIYTESLFLLLVILFFRFLMRGNYPAAGLVASLLPLTKAIGIFCLAPFAWQIWTELGPRAPGFALVSSLRAVLCRGHAKAWTPSVSGKPEIGNQRSERTWWSFGWLLLPLLGYATYFVVMLAFTGNPFEGFQAQRFYPNQPSLGNIVNVARVVKSFCNVHSFHDSMTSGLDRGFFVLFLASLPLIWRLDRTYFWYALFAGAVPALSTWFFSYSRNVMMCFPIFILLAHHLQGRGKGWMVWYYVALMAGVQVFFAIRYVNREWAG
jgi:hypothetical protein